MWHSLNFSRSVFIRVFVLQFKFLPQHVLLTHPYSLHNVHFLNKGWANLSSFTQWEYYSNDRSPHLPHRLKCYSVIFHIIYTHDIVNVFRKVSWFLLWKHCIDIKYIFGVQVFHGYLSGRLCYHWHSQCFSFSRLHKRYHHGNLTWSSLMGI